MTRSRDQAVEINSSDFWVKVVGMLQQNWALVDPAASGTADVYFVDDGGGVFDQVAFPNADSAFAALARNGFATFGIRTSATLPVAACGAVSGEVPPEWSDLLVRPVLARLIPFGTFRSIPPKAKPRLDFTLAHGQPLLEERRFSCDVHHVEFQLSSYLDFHDTVKRISGEEACPNPSRRAQAPSRLPSARPNQGTQESRAG